MTEVLEPPARYKWPRAAPVFTDLINECRKKQLAEEKENKKQSEKQKRAGINVTDPKASEIILPVEVSSGNLEMDGLTVCACTELFERMTHPVPFEWDAHKMIEHLPRSVSGFFLRYIRRPRSSGYVRLKR